MGFCKAKMSEYTQSTLDKYLVCGMEQLYSVPTISLILFLSCKVLHCPTVIYSSETHLLYWIFQLFAIINNASVNIPYKRKLSQPLLNLHVSYWWLEHLPKQAQELSPPNYTQELQRGGMTYPPEPTQPQVGGRAGTPSRCVCGC